MMHGHTTRPENAQLQHTTNRKNKLPYKLATAAHLIVSLPLKVTTYE